MTNNCENISVLNSFMYSVIGHSVEGIGEKNQDTRQSSPTSGMVRFTLRLLAAEGKREGRGKCREER